jgi:hypothetical protein
VWGSAGGLDAYTRLLQHLPSNMGFAIVIVDHPRIVATQLHEILPRRRISKSPSGNILNRLNLLWFDGCNLILGRLPMWTQDNRGRYDRSRLRYPSDLTDEEWRNCGIAVDSERSGGI